jgi:HAE1 family hydrophobic/amphiphilic exporter-1
MTKSAVNRPVTTVMCVLIVFLAGIFAYSSLELAYMPSVDLPVALVSTTYSGTGPEEMEDLVTKPIEQTMATLTGVDTITSQSSTGSSMVAVQFVDGTDIDSAVNDMRDKLDRVKHQLPDDADDPSIMKMDMNAQTIEVGVTSDKLNPTTLYELLDNNVTSQFEKIEGVASADMKGGQEKEVLITADPDKLSNYGITLSTFLRL